MYETRFLYNELTRIMDEYHRAFGNIACENVDDCGKCKMYSEERGECYEDLLNEILEELKDKQ